MLAFEKILQQPDKNIVLSFDLEWTKNYRVSGGNKPFCFSFVYFPSCNLPINIEERLEFGFVARYIESNSEIPTLVKIADQILARFTDKGNVTVVGHQLSSDIAVLLHYQNVVRLDNFSLLRDLWRKRTNHNPKHRVSVFDTRYDLNGFLKGKSRRLVDVCVECNMDVTQPEITSSMTKMHKDFIATRDRAIMERLLVLNIRHSLSAALLYLFFRLNFKPRTVINVNRILYRNLRNYFRYVEEDFQILL